MDEEPTADAVDGPNLVLARATINMPGGIKPGYEYWVNADSAYVQTAIEAGFFVVDGDAETSRDP